MITLNCFIVSVCVVLIIDQFKFVDEITSIFSKMLSNGHIQKPLNIKPLSCSLCMSFWINLIYILVVGAFSIKMIFLILIISWATPITNDLLTLVKTLILKILNKIM